jgi:retron-type reverse transcriptase
MLQVELQLKSYRPKPLETFIIRDPKTRKISKSDFRDRIVHHALCNIIEPIFDKIFIYDSYANRLTKGTLKAVERFEYFQRKVSKNGSINCYILKADIKHYFETVNHKILYDIINKKIKDKNILWLIKIILENHKTGLEGKGMPLGNLTSQFFANVYLNELDYYVKNELSVKFYIRYVDDFVILSNSKSELRIYEESINIFLKEKLDIALHPDKTKILTINKGINFLGLRIYPCHKLLKKSNVRKFKNKLSRIIFNYDYHSSDYDVVYDFIEGWTAYSKNANTYKLRCKILTLLSDKFSGEVSTKEYNRHLKELKKEKEYIQ